MADAERARPGYAGMTVTADGGAVTLTGGVPSCGEKAWGGTAAWNAPGVNTVRNDIAVTCP